ncbi:YceI family protein [Hymenobacter arizonensis]|uniref:YceI-like domain-containing protein n=1 Tax=Hymenobacter arizonensis TaxID=1227077 RepID=A0A1I5WVV5_HYMAR|nr:YceI family protein [Hymenobacter arizonensis]SFQ23751.1 YceI-like domain-containing protein [Hymenobacter arizonensis]
MKRIFSVVPVLLLLATPWSGRAQGTFMTKTGRVSFLSTTILEDIEARNNAAAAVFDLNTGQLALVIPVKEFVFKRSLMQEHFNENYMESDKYPKATFTGRFTGADAATLGWAGSHEVQVEGELTLHGVSHHVKVPGALELKNGQLLASAVFNVAPADYNIEVPLLVRENIAKIVSIRVALSCDVVAGSGPKPTRSSPLK